MNAKTKYKVQIAETIKTVQKLSKVLENATKGKLSTDDITSDRLLWEIFNKISSILITLENSILAKDSLTNQLIARYTYEILVVFLYIFFDESKKEERSKQFIEFEQFKSEDKKWTKITFSDMAKSVSDHEVSEIHVSHYRNLSNFGHPTMDSFLLNRRGDESEFMLILSTTLLTIQTILEIIEVCINKNLYFDEIQKKKINTEEINLTLNKLMKQI